MGDYLHLRDGTQAKIGTAGDDRYMRHDEALRLLALDVGGELRGNLSYVGALWRFPYPHEDADGPPEIAKRDMFHTVSFVLPLRDLLHAGHKSICVPLYAEGGGFGINRLIPCPLSAEDVVYGANIPSNVVNIYGERYDAGDRARTIFRCGYCGQPFPLTSEEELAAYREAFRAFWHREDSDWAEKTAERLRANPGR